MIGINAFDTTIIVQLFEIAYPPLTRWAE